MGPLNRYVAAVSDKELVLDAIERLPRSATLAQIRARLEFIAALKEGERSFDRGEVILQAAVEKQFHSWVKRWRTKSSGRPKRSAISPR